MSKDVITMTGKEFFDDQAAVYTLRRGSEYLYIGATQNIYLRLSVHNVFSREDIEDTDIIQIIPCQNKTAAHELELMLIKIHKPTWNGTQGRGHKGSGIKKEKLTFNERETNRDFDRLIKDIDTKTPKGIDFRSIDKHLRAVRDKR